jgi:hypothetical protein
MYRYQSVNHDEKMFFHRDLRMLMLFVMESLALFKHTPAFFLENKIPILPQSYHSPPPFLPLPPHEGRYHPR